ncbi:hypothetical protein ACQLT9_003137 [Salmonella enterica subsp. diarizonae]|nr:hypothetical protein [Salmonella enterica]
MSKKQDGKIATIAAAMALAMGPVHADSLGYNEIHPFNKVVTTYTVRQLNEDLILIDIREAKKHLHELTDRLRFHLQSLLAEWEEKRTPINIDIHAKKRGNLFLKSINAHIAICKTYIQAVKIALDNPAINESLRVDVIAFGRATASLRYTAEGILSFIEQTHPPKGGHTSDSN